MNRREVSTLLGSVAALAALQPSLATRARVQTEATPPPVAATIGMLVFPGMTALDLIGPQQFFAVAPGRTTQLLWKSREPVVSDTGVPVLPTATFAEAPAELEVLFVPGGFRGTAATIGDPEVLDFVAGRGARATYVTSVCTGALILGSTTPTRRSMRGRRARPARSSRGRCGACSGRASRPSAARSWTRRAITVAAEQAHPG